MQMDRATGTSFWSDACTKRIKQTIDLNVFEVLDDDAQVPEDHQYAAVRSIYDVKDDGSERGKAKMRFVIRGDLIDCLVPTTHQL